MTRTPRPASPASRAAPPGGNRRDLRGALHQATPPKRRAAPASPRHRGRHVPSGAPSGSGRWSRVAVQSMAETVTVRPAPAGPAHRQGGVGGSLPLAAREPVIYVQPVQWSSSRTTSASRRHPKVRPGLGLRRGGIADRGETPLRPRQRRAVPAGVAGCWRCGRGDLRRPSRRIDAPVPRERAFVLTSSVVCAWRTSEPRRPRRRSSRTGRGCQLRWPSRTARLWSGTEGTCRPKWWRRVSWPRAFRLRAVSAGGGGFRGGVLGGAGLLDAEASEPHAVAIDRTPGGYAAPSFGSYPTSPRSSPSRSRSPSGVWAP